MQRLYPLRWLALAIGLLATQCLDSISDDCTKTLTCDEQPPVLGPDCIWRYADGRTWEDGPKYDTATRTWRWPDGKETATQDIVCNLNPDAGADSGTPVADCRQGALCDFPLVCNPLNGFCVECIGDAECSGNMPVGDAGAATVCDIERNECVRCTSNANCGGDTPVCKTDPANSSNNECVECTGDGNCGDEAPVCDESTNDCTTRCATTAECAGSDKPVCNVGRGVCVECENDSTCSGTKTQCEIVNNECVECINDSPCSATGEVCDTTLHACVACTNDSQCLNAPNGAAAPYCDPEDKVCVACLNDTQCTNEANSRCNSVLHVCTGCTDSSQCEEGLFCLGGGCVECLDSTHCTAGGEPFCETTTGNCVECLDSSTCLTQDAAHCDTASTDPMVRFTCVGCEGNGDCAGKAGLGGLCDTAPGLCVFCLSDAECSDSATQSQCVPTGPERGTCDVCASDENCELIAGRPNCKTDQGCVECVDNTDCTGNPDGVICKVNNNGAAAGPAAVDTCVECIGNANCTAAGASRCSGNECLGCSVDADCAHVPGLNVCDGGTCVQCTGPKRAACGTNVCDSLNRTCSNRGERSADLCDDCVSDLECDGDARCVQQSFNGTAVGFFCFPLATGTPASCGGQEFVGAAVTPTIDGQQPPPSMCLLRETTCPGRQDYIDLVECEQDSECGVAGLADGLCEEGPGADTVCTVPCESSFDCPATCDGGSCAL